MITAFPVTHLVVLLSSLLYHAVSILVHVIGSEGSYHSICALFNMAASDSYWSRSIGDTKVFVYGYASVKIMV